MAHPVAKKKKSKNTGAAFSGPQLCLAQEPGSSIQCQGARVHQACYIVACGNSANSFLFVTPCEKHLDEVYWSRKEMEDQEFYAWARERWQIEVNKKIEEESY